MSFQVVIDGATRMVLGVGDQADYTFPEGADLGAEYPIVTLEDQAQLDVLMALPMGGAYLSADGQRILEAPEGPDAP